MLSKKEIKELTISALVLALAFGGFEKFFLSLFIISIAFVAHEVAHKYFAHRFGAPAEYRMWPIGLALALLLSFLSDGQLVFAAPGAVYIYPVVRGPFAFVVHRITRREMGIIALAGPIINIVLGTLFLLLSFFILPAVCYFAAYISFFLAFFNLLPIPPLDGSKVLNWDARIWAITIVIAASAYFFV